MKVILADPPKGETNYITYTANYGILYLISYLQKKHPEVEVHYLEAFMDLDTHLKKIKEIKPDLYGISFATPTMDIAYEAAEAVRKENPSLPIISGGPHPSCSPEDVLRNSKIDIAAIGEGEETFVELVEHYLLKQHELKDIKGIAFLEGDQVVKTETRPFISNLDDIPFPARDKISDPSKYLGVQYVKKWPMNWIIVSRGCPFNCTFCSNPVWKATKPWYRARSPENIAEEVKLLHDQGIKEISLRCDEFNTNLEWAIQVCKEIKKLNLNDLCFSTLLRVDKVTEELAQALADIDCWLVYIGIESGNQRTLDGIGKHITLEQAVNACKTLKKHKIKINGFFMMFNIWEEDGKLCYESPEETMKTLEFGKKMMDDGLIDLMSWGYTMVVPGAPLYNIAKSHNLLSSVDRINLRPSVKLPGIDEKIMVEIKRRGIIIQTFSTLENIKYVNWKQWRQFATVFRSNIPFIKKL